MKFETVLNAMTRAYDYDEFYRPKKQLQKDRQYWKFRDWLVRRDARQRTEIDRLAAEIARMNEEVWWSS